VIFCDNSGSGKIDSSIESIARTKHIKVAHLWIEQEVAKKIGRSDFLKEKFIQFVNPTSD